METLLALLAKGDRRAIRARVRKDLPPNFGEQVFQRISQLSGSDPNAARTLGKSLDLLLPRATSRQDQAYLHRARGAILRLTGQWTDAAAAFLTAGDFLVGPERWVFSLGAVDSLARAGASRDAEELGRKIILGLRGNAVAQARARLNLANVLAWRDENQLAASHYKKALNDLPESMKLERGIAFLGLSTAELLTGSITSAQDNAFLAIRLFQEIEAHHFANLADLNLAHVDLRSGKSDLAVLRLLDLRTKFPIESPEAARIEEFLGDAYATLGLRQEAIESYRLALKLQASRTPLNRANCYYGLGKIHLRDNPREAARTFRQAAKGYRRVGNRPWELSAAAHALVAVGSATSLGAMIDELNKKGASFLADEVSLLACEKGLAALPRPPRSPLHEWKHAWLRARGNKSLAGYRRMFQLILRDRASLTSPNAAMRFLDERSVALREFGSLLMSKGRIKELTDMVGEVRSSALLDEILSAQTAPLHADDLKMLDRIRLELASDGTTGTRVRTRSTGSASLRLWMEQTWKTRSTVLGRASNPQIAGDLWFEHAGDWIRIRGEQTSRCPQAEIVPLLDWTEFALLEPMFNQAASPEKVHDSIQRLAHALGQPAPTVCPEGELWRVPWTLLSREEVVLQLSPRFGTGAAEASLPKEPRVAIWAASAPDLPSADSEVEILLREFPETQILRSREEVRATYGQTFDLIHIAGHARIHPSQPAFSLIEFPDGPLYAAEISRSAIRVRIAVLAACETGITTSHLSFEPEGLVRAFLACGAQVAIGSLWPLDDRFTYQFMSDFYPMISSGSPVGKSLAFARQQGRSRSPHPYFWGAMAMFGGYR